MPLKTEARRRRPTFIDGLGQPARSALTAKLNKLTIKVERPKPTEEDIKKLETAVATVLDGKPLHHVQVLCQAQLCFLRRIRWVAVERDGSPVARIDVYSEHDGPFTELIVWRRFVVLGLGQAVHLIDPHNQQTWSLECDGYFGHLYPLGDRLLIASASALVCLDDQGKKVWQREHLGIDGVVVEGVEGGIVTGKGEWDPPGGWRPFRLLPATGVPTTE